MEALFCDLPPCYCREVFSVHIAFSLLQFVLYSLPLLLRLIDDGIGSFIPRVIGCKAVVARVEALLSDLRPYYCRYDFSMLIALTFLQFVSYPLLHLCVFLYSFQFLLLNVTWFIGVIARVEVLLLLEQKPYSLTCWLLCQFTVQAALLLLQFVPYSTTAYMCFASSPSPDLEWPLPW